MNFFDRFHSERKDILWNRRAALDLESGIARYEKNGAVSNNVFLRIFKLVSTNGNIGGTNWYKYIEHIHMNISEYLDLTHALKRG